MSKLLKLCLLISLVSFLNMASVSANYSDMGHEIKATPEEVIEFNKEMENMGIPSYEEMGELLKNVQPNELINGNNFDINEGSISTYNYVAIPWSTVKYSDLKNVVNQQWSYEKQYIGSEELHS